MGLFLELSQKEVESMVNRLGIVPAENYLVCFSKMNKWAKVGLHALLENQAIFSGLFEKRFLIVFAEKEIFLQPLFGAKKIRRFKRNEVKAFTVEEGVNQATVFRFVVGEEQFAFYAYRDATGRVAYVAENLQKLQDNQWNRYLSS